MGKSKSQAARLGHCNRFGLFLLVALVFNLLLLVLPTFSVDDKRLPPHQTDVDYAGPVNPDYLQTSAMKNARLQSCPTHLRLQTHLDMTLPQFIDRTFESINQVVVNQKPIYYLAENANMIWKERGGLTNGFWAEFGVYNGRSLTSAFNKIEQDLRATLVFAGFDSFDGLPTAWRAKFNEGTFKTSYDAVRAEVPAVIELYKGWFQDTIGQFLIKHPDIPAAFIHHDGDLFVSTSITFSLLASRIFPGTIMCFDELVGYPAFEQHEILSLFLWMQEYHATLCPLGVKHAYNQTDRNPDHDLPPESQSVCFQVLSLTK
jgi:hypothetical protein